MKVDIRSDAAFFYDLNPDTPDDIAFYRQLIPSPDANVLELGCGTGRVLCSILDSCRHFHGIEISEAMLTICKNKLKNYGEPTSQVAVEKADIANFNLNEKFDLIIAPFRVFQNIEENEKINGLFKCVRKHLSDAGTCILNVFNPNMNREELHKNWCSNRENFNWKVPVSVGCVTCHDRRPKMNLEPLTLYPELIYRHYEEDILKKEAVLKIVMRCYYPNEFRKLIINHGFRILNQWGGYAGEKYAEGPELIIQFEDNS